MRPKRAADMEKKSNDDDEWSILIPNLFLMTCVALILGYCIGPELKLGGQFAINSLNYYLLGSLI